MKKLLGILLPLALGGSLLLAAPAATAATSTSGDVILYATDQSAHRTQCTSSAAFYIGLASTAEYADWQADITVTSPTGATWLTTTLSPSEFLGSFGTWCASKHASGKYVVKAVFTGFDESAEVIATKTLTTTMSMTALPDVVTGVQVRKKKLGKKKWLVAGRLLNEGTAWPQRRVTMQVLAKGAWRDVIGSTTDGNGVVGFVAKPTKAFRGKKFRLHFAGSGYVRSSSSTTFKLPRR